MEQKQNFIGKQAYVKVIREMSSIGKSEYEEQRTMYLYKDKLVTAHHEFKIEEIMDVSFKQIKDKGGILFLHSDHGVYSYTVQSSPEEFIQICKDHLNNE